RRVGCGDARFRGEHSGSISNEQVPSGVASGGEGDRAAGSDQFTHANTLKTDVARGARYLSGQRDLGLQPGGPGQSAAGRLRAASRVTGKSANRDAAELMRSWPDGRIKLFLTHRLLRFR